MSSALVLVVVVVLVVILARSRRRAAARAVGRNASDQLTGFIGQRMGRPVLYDGHDREAFGHWPDGPACERFGPCAWAADDGRG